jgi:hypothetical protein
MIQILISRDRGIAQCNHGVALPIPCFYNLIIFLIILCVFTFNYSNNVDLAIRNKFIYLKISRDTKDEKNYYLINKFILL